MTVSPNHIIIITNSLKEHAANSHIYRFKHCSKLPVDRGCLAVTGREISRKKMSLMVVTQREISKMGGVSQNGGSTYCCRQVAILPNLHRCLTLCLLESQTFNYHDDVDQTNTSQLTTVDCQKKSTDHLYFGGQLTFFTLVVTDLVNWPPW